MMKTKTFIWLFICILLIIGAVFYFSPQNSAKKQETQPVVSSGVEQKAISDIPTYTYTKTYTHPAKDFSFQYPDGFTITSIPNEVGDESANKGEIILVQNTKTKVGVQISITPFDGADIDITKSYIQSSISDMKISDEQPVEIGVNRKGLAFLSDNEAFANKSREVWFVFKGNLYQISTYAELDEFLKGIFSTWKFL